ncbi:MAG: ABC transporter substrate-binding protein [Acetobacteraceae bacterium]|nr:ABC transporter substrate-binding protein [Acetobacteraceae bacterium]
MSRMRATSAIVLALSMLLGNAAWGQSPATTIKIGVLNDMSGPYADFSGKESVIAAQMAADDFAKEAGSKAPRVEILSADHQNKADVGAAITRKWVDQDGGAAVVDVPNSSVALAVNQVLREKDRTFLASSTATSDLTGPQCAPTTVQWTMDTWALANGTARPLVKSGGDTWFFVTADYAFGKALERDASDIVRKTGGRVLGDALHPLDTSDFSSYLLQAQSSGAKVIALANAGTDASNAIKQAAEFGIGRGSNQRLAALLVFITDIDALGLQVAQGLLLTEAFYWDLNEQTRAWSKRFAERAGGRVPTMNHAGVYSSVLAYLRAAEKVGIPANGAPSGRAMVAQMGTSPIDDPLFGPTTIRKDGRAVHAMYLFQVKTPGQSSGRWDYYKLVATIPPEEAFRPMGEGGCPLVK